MSPGKQGGPFLGTARQPKSRQSSYFFTIGSLARQLQNG